jgi:hypothetical protein
MEFIKLSQEVVDISKKLESISKKLVKSISIHINDETVPALQSPGLVKSNPSDLPPAGIQYQQTSRIWQQSLRKRN